MGKEPCDGIVLDYKPNVYNLATWFRMCSLMGNMESNEFAFQLDDQVTQQKISYAGSLGCDENGFFGLKEMKCKAVFTT